VITNYSSEKTRRVELKFEADYECKVEDVKAAISKVVKANEMVLKDPAPFIKVSAYKESSIEYVVRVWTSNADYWTVYFDLMEEVKKSFDKNKIAMTYNHLNVHLMNK
jgi:small conductance mechanosensitive channel